MLHTCSSPDCFLTFRGFSVTSQAVRGIQESGIFFLFASISIRSLTFCRQGCTSMLERYRFSRTRVWFVRSMLQKLSASSGSW